MLTKIRRRIAKIRDAMRLPRAAKTQRRIDRKGLPGSGRDLDTAVDLALAWIASAQARNTSGDDGMARFYSLVSGWSPSYPASTGHTIPVLLLPDVESHRTRESARRMLDWLLALQLPTGAFPGGLVTETNVAPTSFSTGSVLLGLAAGAQRFGDPYAAAMQRCADWLRGDQDDDGCWRNHLGEFAKTRDNTFDMHIAWALLEAHRARPDRGYMDAALNNVEWALQYQSGNGWIDRCCQSDPETPLSHTLGFAFRGIVEAYRATDGVRFEQAAVSMADGLMQALDARTGLLPGRIDRDWRGRVAWSCPTANAQIALGWWRLFEHAGDARYADAARVVNRSLRRIVTDHADEGIRGGCKGSFPIDGGYAAYRFLTPRFCIESWSLERRSGT